MTVTLTPRLNLTRWGSDEDAWSREEIDANFGKLDAASARFDEALAAARPAAGIARRLFLATDTGRVSLDTGAAWRSLATLDTANTWDQPQTFTGGVTGDLAVAGNITQGGATLATDAELAAHTGQTTGAHAATAIAVTPTGGIAAVTVQAALAELDTEKATTTALTAHTGASAGAHAATAITYAGSTNLSATTVEAALDELDTEKHPKITAQGVYNLNGAADRTLGAYASDPESAAYTATPAALTDAATLANLNSLRAAYENLRTYVEDMAGVVIGTATDLKTLGILG